MGFTGETQKPHCNRSYFTPSLTGEKTDKAQGYVAPVKGEEAPL